ncbi:hypothetical protein ACWGQ5_43640 [Streptomyces sp. NPDC055722]
MARQLRFNGTGGGEGGCPAVHEDLDSGEVIVQGRPITDPDDLRQLQYFDPEREVAVVVPRNTLVDFGPRDETVGADKSSGLVTRHGGTRAGFRRVGLVGGSPGV